MNYFSFSEPSHENDPVEGIRPVQSDQMHFFSLNNDGIIPGLNPFEKQIKFWTEIARKAVDLSDQIKDGTKNHEEL